MSTDRNPVMLLTLTLVLTFLGLFAPAFATFVWWLDRSSPVEPFCSRQA